MKNTTSRTLSRFLLACLFGASVPATAKPPQSLDELKATIEAIRVQTHTPAVGIALVNKDGPLWVAGLGEANVEKHVQANENTMVRVASASKMLVGLSILKLVEEGKLHTDYKLRDVAPEVPFSNPWEHTTGWDARPSEYAAEAPDSMPLLALQGLMRVR